MDSLNLSLTTEAYAYGTYPRAAFRGYLQHYRYSLAGLTLVRAPGVFLAEDELFQRLIAAGAASAECFDRYVSALREHFSQDESWDVTSEEMYLRADLIRRDFISREKYLGYRDSLLGDAISLPPPGISGIDQGGELDRLKAEKSSVLIVPGGAETFPEALREALGFLDAGKKVFLLLKADQLSPLSSERDFEVLLGMDEFDSLRGIAVIKDEGPSRGIDYSSLPYNQALQECVDRGDIFLRGFGEDVLLSVKELRIPAIVGAGNQSFHAKAVLGDFSDGRYSLVYIPEGFSIFSHVSIVESSSATYAGMAAPESGAPSENALRAGAESSPAVSLRRVLHDYGAEGEAGDGFENRAVIDIAEVNIPAKAEVICVEDYKGLSLRQYFRDMGWDVPRRLVSNFLFFVTPGLVRQYNGYRADRPREQINPGNIYLDYRLQNKGERLETFPLFDKACVSLDSSGGFRFFSRGLEAGSIEMGGIVLSWSKTDVNPQDAGDIALFTPAFAKLDGSVPVKEYRKEVGHNRFNMVFVGQNLTCARLGEVILPSVGTVISIKPENGRRLAAALKMTPAEDGYYDIPPERATFSLNLAPPEGFTYKQWSDVEWACGGGMTLIRDGVCVCDDDEVFEKSLTREGWLSALSIQTQESGVHAPMRHPRTAIGQTEDGKLVIMVISGRRKSSQGASPKEIANLGRKYIPNLKNLINVDGGASSFLALTGDGGFAVINEACASNETSAGEARAVTSVLAVEL